MTTTTWLGATGSFTTAASWSGGTTPGSGDIAVVDSSSGAATILIAGTQSVAGLKLDDVAANLSLTGELNLNGGTLDAQAGTLTLSGTLDSGSLVLSGATLRFADTDPVSGGVVMPTLFNVTVIGTLDLSGSNTTLDVQLFQPGVLTRIGLNGGITVDGIAEPDWGAVGDTHRFDGGELVALSATSAEVIWSGGEVLTIVNRGIYFDLGMRLAAANGPGSVQGLLGSNSGQATDFQLPDGTVLAPPASDDDLLGTVATAWSVGAGQSLLSEPGLLSGPGIVATSATIASADFTGDGVADLLRADATGNLFVLNGATGGQTAVSQSADGLTFLAATDLNGDGKADLLMQDTSTGGLYDWTMNGADAVRTDLITVLKNGASFAQAASFHDGSAEILLQNVGVQQWF
jgi:hypothetical protein